MPDVDIKDEVKTINDAFKSGKLEFKTALTRALNESGKQLLSIVEVKKLIDGVNC